MIYAYNSVKEPIGELNLKRALDEDTGVFSSFFSLLSSSSPLGQVFTYVHQILTHNTALHTVCKCTFQFTYAPGLVTTEDTTFPCNVDRKLANLENITIRSKTEFDTGSIAGHLLQCQVPLCWKRDTSVLSEIVLSKSKED